MILQRFYVMKKIMNNRYNNLLNLDLHDEFPIYKNVLLDNQPLIYFDSGATTLRPQSVIDAINYYYQNVSASSHSHEYKLAYTNEINIRAARDLVAEFLSCHSEEIHFTSGTTMGINAVCFALNDLLTKSDAIVMGSDAHTSLALPCRRLSVTTKANLLVLDLHKYTDNYSQFINHLPENTKLLVFPHISNVLGHYYDLDQIAKGFYERFPNGYLLVDGAQSFAHKKLDLKKTLIDFYAFGAHKAYGPSGIGGLFIRNCHFQKFNPLMLGGNMNEDVYKNASFTFKPFPFAMESGTQNYAGIYGLKACIEFLQNIGWERIDALETNLRNYALTRLKKVLGEKIIIYNNDIINKYHIVFNIEGVFAQDVASYLGSKNICVRSGDHCAKLLNYSKKINPSVRVTFGVYNSDHEIDALCKALASGGDFLDEFFR